MTAHERLATLVNAEVATYRPITSYGMADIDYADRGLTIADGSDMAYNIALVVRDSGYISMPSEVALNRMAQKFYEVASDSGVLTVHSMAGGKPAIVDALRAALEHHLETEGWA